MDSVIREIGWSPPSDPTLEPPAKRHRALRVVHAEEGGNHTVKSVVVRPKKDVPMLREAVVSPQGYHPVPSPKLADYSDDDLGNSPGITLGKEEEESTVSTEGLHLLGVAGGSSANKAPVDQNE